MIFAFLPAMGAEDYRYTLTLDKSRAMVKTPMILTVDIEQTDPSKVLFFDFEPSGNGRFLFHRLDKKVNDDMHHRRERFDYLVYGLQSGEWSIGGRIRVQRTNEERIVDSTIVDQFNARTLQSEESLEPVTPVKVTIDPLPVPADLVGDFHLESSLDRRQTEAFRPIHLSLHLKGVGFPPPGNLFGWNIPGVQVFADKPAIRLHYTSRGVEVDATYTFAFSSDHDFTIPLRMVRLYSPTRHQSERIGFPGATICVVTPPSLRKALLDPKNDPPSIYDRIATWKAFGIDTLVVLLGFISAFFVEWLKSRLKRFFAKDPFVEKVRAAKDPRALLMLLIRADAKRCAPWIDRIEAALHEKRKIDLKKIKREIVRGCR
ncbi:BatD family protein [Hydrogenimonas urashimensis]|uniref:BatD family protein n=1 Tax=Hydrogenimonas urashimensis TaxID=2740515 RepID=UPI0019151917|nr:BatD family protein [Hydrogenimonas urashimensis]